MSAGFISEILLETVPNERSYLHGLPVVRYLCAHPRLALECDVTILVGENGTGKSTLLEAVAVSCGFNPEGGSRNFNFPPTPHTPSCTNVCASFVAPILRTAIFCARKAFTTWRPTSRSWTGSPPFHRHWWRATAADRCIINHMGRAFLLLCKTVWAATDSTCSTSPRLHSHRCAS